MMFVLAKKYGDIHCGVVVSYILIVIVSFNGKMFYCFEIDSAFSSVLFQSFVWNFNVQCSNENKKNWNWKISYIILIYFYTAACPSSNLGLILNSCQFSRWVLRICKLIRSWNVQFGMHQWINYSVIYLYTYRILGIALNPVACIKIVEFFIVNLIDHFVGIHFLGGIEKRSL